MANEVVLNKNSIDKFLDSIYSRTGYSPLKLTMFRGQKRRYFKDKVKKQGEIILPSIFRDLARRTQNSQAQIIRNIYHFFYTEAEYRIPLQRQCQDINEDIYNALLRSKVITKKSFRNYKELSKVVPHIFYNSTTDSKQEILDSLNDYESFYFFDYLNKYPKSCSSDTQGSIESLLIEMQQKGKYTRLLDITTNPLVALYNALDQDKKEPGVVYVFEEDKHFLYEFSFQAKRRGKAAVHSRVVSYLKEFYLSLVNSSNPDDVNMNMARIIAKISSSEKFQISKTDINSNMTGYINSLKEFFQQYKLKNNTDNYNVADLNSWSNIKDHSNFDDQNQLLRQFFKKVDGTSGAMFLQSLLLNFLELFGLPILISPNAHAHEQITANRILTQNAKFLLWPNKILNNGNSIENKFAENYCDKLLKIIIPARIKDDLKQRIERIYNDSMFYSDAIPNSYVTKP